MGATAAPVRRLPLATLHANEDYQPRARGVEEAHIRLLVESAPDKWPPLLVTPNDAGGYDVVDGFHRLAAAARLGLTDVPCIVEGSAGYPEAVAANLRHGLPLSLSDRKEYARGIRDNEPGASLREIGRRCGLSHNTVKEALAPAGAGQSDRAAHPDFAGGERDAGNPPDAVAKLVKLAYRAARDGSGVSKLAAFFSGKSDRRQRAEHVRRQLAGYDAEERAAVAAALTALGATFIEGAQPYLTGEDAS